MSIFLLIIALLASLFLAHIRVQNADDIYKKRVLTLELCEALEKNYLQEIESVYSICANFFECEISDGDAEMLKTILCEKLYLNDADFFKSVLSLSSACGTEIDDIITNIKDFAKKSKEKALSELNGIKSSAYIFYPGIVFILALLVL